MRQKVTCRIKFGEIRSLFRPAGRRRSRRPERVRFARLAWLKDILSRIADRPIPLLAELLPHHPSGALHANNESMVRLDAVLSSWKTVREDTAQAVEDFAPHQLDYKPCEGVMSFGETARHILDAGHGLSGMLLDGEDNLATPQFRETIGKHVAQLPKTEDAGALARALRSQMERRSAELAAKSPEFYAGQITRMDGQRVTRLEMLQLIKEHELTHRQQLFMYLRLNGVVPPTTRRRQAKAKA